MATGSVSSSPNLEKESRELSEAQRESIGLDLGKQNQVNLGLTNKRVLIWSCNFFGAPKKLIGTINITDIKSIEKVNSKLFVANMPTVRITLKNDNFFDLQAGKIFVKNIEQLITEFKQLNN